MTKVEIESELSRLEALDTPTLDDLQRIETLKSQLAELDLVISTESVESGPKYRPLSKLEVRRLQDLAQSPGFQALTETERLDQICLLITGAMGFGSFNAEFMSQLFRQIGMTLSLEIQTYFRDSKDSVSGQVKYIAVGGGAFKVNRLVIHSLKSVPNADEDEPIRKKVVGRPPPSPMAPPKPRSASPPRRSPKPAPILKADSPKQEVATAKVPQINEDRGSQSGHQGSYRKIVLISILALVLVGALVFVLAQS